MTKTFDEAYARYLRALERLDTVDDISEKNLLFRQLARQLSELEERLNGFTKGEAGDPAAEAAGRGMQSPKASH